MAELKAEEGGEAVRDAAEEILENTFLRATEGDDFVGVQCYTRMHFGPAGKVDDDPSVPQTQMGLENWPHAVEYAVRRTAAFTNLPVVITESGIATENDAERITYLSEVIGGVRRCLDDGIDVRGYFVWRPKPSARWYAHVVGTNSLAPAP
jgi:beta-glucosidase